ncbi:GNAT family N-acetyltransferase [Pseudomonas viridiflava]|uniref:GNAT family N-acetyltransferase n=1 Tax=Pseudomonas viridiflava TaxID=33069 RepID=UPI000C07ACC7|nr:GNAT family N-acetyltransferase [Pseudomonas viridiflava]MEE4859230.1 GNAT family N-acetyltransferase [Pseudomonas alliivorans]MEE4902904.1 GNAT family N-acetyltransferase [Pseudomonas alliivorans]MEE4955690.1 GNAT family N-acetyltransferase [Pseudomonas alliivorans]MEE4964620.1 GNAT family N-acetyltransferase [Pseudomonas alliivorans]MEE4986024.1 GNAT family N-acetyltransferase [Pseudomonas alliivorans]
MKPIETQHITHLPAEVLTLEKEAIAEGFRFLTRLMSEWHSGKNRFNAPGECLMAAYLNQQLIGIGGLSVDPYNQPNTARLRRVYVVPAAINQHVGHALVKALVAHAALHFQKVHLSTGTSAGDAFYLCCGFMRTEDAHATHIMELINP